MRTIGMKHGCRLRDRLVAAIFALAVPSIAFADEASICQQVLNGAPGGSIQLKVPPVDRCDPTPIIIDLMSICLGGDTGAVKGVTLPESPDAAGSAVNDGSSLVIRTVSPAPTIAVTIAVPDQAPVETTEGVTPDPGASPTVSVTDVLPGGGLLPAGSVVAVVGIGFQPEAQVLIDDVAVATSWVDSSRIEVVSAVDVQLDGKRITVANPDGTGATYLSYLRATDLGKSARPLLAATEAIFPVQTRSSAAFAAPAGGTFFGLALQNPDPADAIVSVELWDAGEVVASASLALPSRTKVSRELSELFPGIALSADGFLQVTATVPVQMLGLSGNEVDGSVTPVLPAFASP